MEYDPKSQVSNKFLKLALRRIHGEDYNENIQHRHAAVVVKGGRVLAVGRNRAKTHPDSIFYEDGQRILKSIHAELDAISRVKNKEQLRGATIYVARLGRAGSPGMSCPCKMCQQLINKHGLKRAIFTTEYGSGTLEFSGEVE